MGYLLLCLVAGAVGAAPAPTAESLAALAQAYGRDPAIRQVVLSPNGKRLAMLLAGPPTGRDRLAVMDLDPRGQPRVIAGYKDADVERVQWVSDDRLVYDAIDRSQGLDLRENATGTFAVNHDGTDSRLLAALRSGNWSTGTSVSSRVLNHRWSVGQPLAWAEDEVLAREWREDARGEFLGYVWGRLNTRDGRLHNLPPGMPNHATAYLPGPQGGGLVQVTHAGRQKLQYRPDGTTGWRVLQDEDYVSGQPYRPRYLQTDGLAWVNHPTREGYLGLYGLDTAAGKLNETPLLAVKGFDLTGSLEYDGRTGRVVGVHFSTDSPQTYWLDDGLAQIQRSVDAALPAGRSNALSCGNCETSSYIAIRSESDRQPGEFYLYHRATRRLEMLGTARPWLDETRQATRSAHRAKAQDGLSIPVYVTHPAGSTRQDRLPAVVLVHGGPHVRGTDTLWSAEAQFLAAMGYRVIEPEFRGSTGYGVAHFQAGLRQWGTGMIDDLRDAVRWAAGEGLVDENRVCVMGSSYGGYAALMSTIRHPASYRCAISFAGVTDIALHYEAYGSDMTEEVRRYGLPASTGHPEAARDVLDSISPLQRAAEIKVPVLLMHGLLDRRVTSEHSEKLRAAAKKAGVDVTYVPFEQEGHGFTHPDSMALYLRRVGEFLVMHLQATPATTARQ
jgi:dienelactone hydrolase